MTQTSLAPTSAPSPAGSSLLDPIRRRLEPIEDRLDPYAWAATIVVTFLAAVVRLVNLGYPNQEIFDEVYYANDANDMLSRGIEWDEKTGGPGYVVHPPLGKWMIAIGIKLAHYDAFGWRLSAAIVGVISVLMITRIARRMFGSTVLGCAAGLLMAFDGMHFVLSRSALLDIFLFFFILAAFGTLLLDRDQRRRRWARFIEDGGDPSAKGRPSRPPFAVPWWRLATAVLLGCATGVKWSALFMVPAFLILIMWWEVGARRTAGARQPLVDAILDEIGWLILFVVIIFLVYVATWSGWLLTDNGYYRHFLRDSGQNEPPFLGALYNLWKYHEAAYGFHRQLADIHPYQSKPWQWLVLGRPVAFYFSKSVPCGATDCSAEVVLLGTPVLWWSFIPALLATLWFGIARRDWRAAAILTMSLFALGPWFFYPNRTMFFFYALPAEPFLILAVVFVLGAIMTSPAHEPRDENRLLVGTVIAGVFVLLVALNFAYFYPIFVGDSLPTTDWSRRMWLGRLWI
ncbi:MAG TPA: phospholipid carrier-dependent glycosyltransferase [Candidatus Limnocylindrales bacterium]|nr:phospholipid carrier-dependent glycosyltransferase [Candidatus Limnocylindrales bacterium]